MAFMRHNNNGRRHNNHNRHRHQNNPNQQGGQRRPSNRINQVFESNGPEGRIRGTAQQIVEKYAQMARDASASGDKVLMLNYLQHAEHYQRLLNEILEEQGIFEREREQQRQQQNQQPDVTVEEGAEGFVSDDQQSAPQQQQQQRPQRSQQRPQNQQNNDDDNALPNFLQVPITSSEQSDKPRGLRPRRATSTGENETEN